MMDSEASEGDQGHSGGLESWRGSGRGLGDLSRVRASVCALEGGQSSQASKTRASESGLFCIPTVCAHRGVVCGLNEREC